MSHTRQPLGPEEWGVLIGCSTCPGSFHWPQEISRQSNGIYQCDSCRDPSNALDDARRVANARHARKEESAFRLPGAPNAGYWDETS